MSERATAIPESVYQRLLTESPRGDYWDVAAVHELLTADREQSKRSTERFLADLSWLPQPLNVADLQDEDGRGLVALVADSLQEKAKRLRLAQWVVQTTTLGQATLVTLNDGRHSRRWRWINEPLSDALWRQTLEVLLDGRDAMLWPQGAALPLARQWVLSEGSHQIKTRTGVSVELALGAYRQPRQVVVELATEGDAQPASLDHLGRLEAESIHIMREVMAQADNPVMLYSVGKDSAVMLHLARKAFYPSPPPFPLLHVDTRWKFQQMYDFRDQMAKASGMPLIVHINPEGVAQDINPFDHGSAIHTDIMKTKGFGKR